MTSALLISTYNWPEALRLVMISALSQTHLPSKIIIADDGSAKETEELISEFQLKSAVPIFHFHQTDKGFRKAKNLNKAIAGTDVDYIIQVDGDCILHPNFVKDHLSFAEKGVYLYGSRVNLLPNAVGEIFKTKKIYFNVFSSEIKNRTRTLHIPFLSRLYKSHEGISKKFRGCNVSFWRKDFITINGYNEDFEGWGREDSDLAIRLGNNHIKAKRLRYAGIVYHIFHKINSKDHFELNDKMQKETIANRTVRILNGVDKYLK